MRVFLAGATGIIGRALTPLLVKDGHEVTGMTRSAERARRLAGGRVAVVSMTQLRGASNAKAKRELGWSPARTSWREELRRRSDQLGPADAA